MATVYAPNPQHDGTTATVKFRDGQAEVTDAYLLDWFRRRGYIVEGDEGGEGPPPESGPGSSRQTWIDYVVSVGVLDREDAESRTKSELIEALRAGNE